jgi:hypothetical protein
MEYSTLHFLLLHPLGEAAPLPPKWDIFGHFVTSKEHQWNTLLSTFYSSPLSAHPPPMSDIFGHFEIFNERQ